MKELRAKPLLALGAFHVHFIPGSDETHNNAPSRAGGELAILDDTRVLERATCIQGEIPGLRVVTLGVTRRQKSAAPSLDSAVGF